MPQSEEHLAADSGSQPKPSSQASGGDGEVAGGVARGANGVGGRIGGGASRLDNWIAGVEKLLAFVTCLCAATLPLPITWSWIALILGLVVWIIWKISLLVKHRKLSLIVLGPLTVPLLVFFFATAISGLPSLFGHDIPAFTMHDMFQSLTSLRTFIVYFWAFDVFWNFPELRRIAIACLLVASAFSGLFGAYEQLFNWHPGFKFLQGTGFQSGPMAFAGQMQIFAMLALGFIVDRSFRVFPRPLENKFFYATVVVANIAGVLFASERNAWLGFLVAFILWTSLVSRQLMIKSLLVLAIGAGFAWFCIPVVQIRLRPLMDWQHEVSSKARMIVWQEAITRFETNPVTGIGATKFPRLAIAEAIVPGRSVALDHAHSNYLHVLATTGIIGFLAYLYIIIATLVLAWRNYKYRSTDTSLRANIDRAIGLAVLCATVALLVSGIFEYNFGTGPVRLPQWFVVALIGRPGENRRKVSA
jgi:O-antigen ligase